MTRPKVAGDEHAAAELDRMAARFDAEAQLRMARISDTAETDLFVERERAHVRAYRMAARDCRNRATRLRNGTAGR